MKTLVIAGLAMSYAACAAETPYVPSSVLNVWVRSVPEPAPPLVPGPAQVAVLPGGAPPTVPPAPAGALPEIYTRTWALPGGGSYALVPPQYHPVVVAVRGVDGRVHIQCREPEHTEQQPATGGSAR